jgi:hypothetical protein
MNGTGSPKRGLIGLRAKASNGSRWRRDRGISLSGIRGHLIITVRRPGIELGWPSTRVICPLPALRSRSYSSRSRLSRVSYPRSRCAPPLTQSRPTSTLKTKPLTISILFDPRLLDVKGTTHWPQALQLFVLPCLRDGQPDPHNRPRPSKEPSFTERGWKLTGIPYITSTA